MSEPPLSVRRTGIGVFIVKSQRRSCDDWHTVSLSEPQFPAGQCSCPQFWFRVEPFLVRNLAPEWGEDCVHIRRVRAELQHAATLCEAAGLPFSEAIIPPA